MGQKGQTSLEYTLMITVVTILIFSVFGKLKEKLVGEGVCPNDSFMCKFIELYGGDAFFGGNYRAYNLR